MSSNLKEKFVRVGEAIQHFLSQPLTIRLVLLLFLLKYIVKHTYRALLRLETNDIPFAFVFWNKEYWHITWKTHLVFAACVSVLLWLPFFIFYRIRKTPLSTNILLTATSVSVALFLLEILLCIVPVGRTYWENQGNAYSSIFVPSKNRLFHHNAGISFWQKNVEFEYAYHTNQSGFVGEAWQLDKPAGKKRIVTSGDSFTEGVGAPMDSSYPVLLQRTLGENYEVLSVGVAGSDPVFGYKIVEEIMLPYRPDIVVQTIAENDIFFDIGIRGGMERFVGDSVLKYNDPPIIEPLYAISYTSRVFIEVLGFSYINKWMYDSYVQDEAVIKEKNEILFDLISRYEQLAAANHFEVYIVFLPMIHEMKTGKYRFDVAPLKNHIAALQHVRCIDLMPCYREAMEQKYALIHKYYWKQDKHHNSAGYQLMAKCIAAELLNK